MKNYVGSCHCGNIQFSFSGPEITQGLRCNCSLCRRKGAIMTDFVVTPSDMKIKVQDDCLETYQFGSRVAKHYFCKKCGIYPFHQTARKIDHYRINIGCIDGVDSLALPFDVFDGASL